MNLKFELFLWRGREQQAIPQYSRAKPEELINTVKTSVKRWQIHATGK
jgi:hypothetical protein